MPFLTDHQLRRIMRALDFLASVILATSLIWLAAILWEAAAR